MNRARARELLPIIEAFANGEDIQIKERSDRKWRDVLDTNKVILTWHDGCEYRIKPKEPREFWVFPEINDHESAEHEYCCMGSKPDNPNYIKVREVL